MDTLRAPRTLQTCVLETEGVRCATSYYNPLFSLRKRSFCSFSGDFSTVIFLRENIDTSRGIEGNGIEERSEEEEEEEERKKRYAVKILTSGQEIFSKAIYKRNYA